jgi:hypothetical protein
MAKKQKKKVKSVDSLVRQLARTVRSSTPAPSSNYAVWCHACSQNSWTYGMGGGAASSQGEATISAYANGWYIANMSVCPDCIEKIIEHKDKLQELTNKSSAETSV